MSLLSSRSPGLLMSLLAASLFFFVGCTNQKAFDSPERAADALVQSLRYWSPNNFNEILGPGAGDILSSGDEVADKRAAQKFVQAYDEKHSFTTEDNGTVTLVVGENDWPLPIPLVKDGSNKWRFDGKAGEEEIVNRRIGRNELDVIQVCEAIIDAQREYAAADPNKQGVKQYAQKFMSDEGKKNGLYWPTAEGETPSPIGPQVADAVVEGYAMGPNTTNEPRPFHGYCYRMLTSQGSKATGGAMDYLVDGKMTKGFAAVAYPADYGNSGIMTFIVSHEGIVYQRDLGEDTEKTAKEMKTFDPGPGWQPIAVNASAIVNQ